MPAFSDQQHEDQFWMQQALEQAHLAAAMGEVPVGAVVVSADGIVIGRGFNRPISSHDASAHAEIMALRDAGARQGNYRLVDSTLYVTIEPCLMCAGALVHARVKRVVFGAAEPKAGAVCSRYQVFELEHLNHRVEVCGGVLSEVCSEVISRFFKTRRQQKKLARDAEP